MPAFSKSNKIKEFIAPKMTDISAFLDNNRKLAVYTGGDIRRLYRYLDIIGSPTTLNTSGQFSNNFGP